MGRGLRAALAAAATLAVGATTSAAADWARYGGDDAVTNDVPAERAAGISSQTVQQLVERWSVDVGGWFVASPLYAENVRVGGDVANVVFAATNAGTVAALRAGDGAVLWKRRVSTTVTACQVEYGISSTPVLDRARNRIYVAGADGLLYALDMSTGATVPGWPVRVSQLTGTEYVWSGLALAGTRLYVPVASYCDEPDSSGYLADGRLVAVDVADASIVATLDIVPGPNNMGGIWGYGGISIDAATGHLWATTGNSSVYDPGCGCNIETAGYGESVIELDQDLNVVAWSRPEGLPFVEDNDFGATPLLFQPPGCPPLAAANAKNGVTYIWDRENVAGGPMWQARIGPGELGASFLGQPSYSPELNTLVVSDARDYDDQGTLLSFDAVVGFSIGPDCAIPGRPTWTAPNVGRGPKTPPLIVSDVVFVPGGFDHGVYALDAHTGETLWSAVLPGAVLAPISFADGLVLVADSTGTLHAFGSPRPTRGPGGRNLIPM